jgi:hypothetical protein
MFLHHATYMIYSIWLNAQNSTQHLLTDSLMNSLNDDAILISHFVMRYFLFSVHMLLVNRFYTCP